MITGAAIREGIRSKLIENQREAIEARNRTALSDPYTIEEREAWVSKIIACKTIEELIDFMIVEHGTNFSPFWV